jgi:hypothetical protein
MVPIGWIATGARPLMSIAFSADLPVEAPMVINLKTAKALGFEVPPSLLAIADEADARQAET